MDEQSRGPVDPRIRRTRRLLQKALEELLKRKDFEKISVQDIADAATVNRATFYDHYRDRFSLLQCMVGERFCELVADREVHFDLSCGAKLVSVVLAVCDYLAGLTGPEGKRDIEPHMESAIIAVVRRILLEGLALHPVDRGVAPEMIAAAASWALYGAAKEWAQSPGRCPSERVAESVARLISPVLHGEGVKI